MDPYAPMNMPDESRVPRVLGWDIGGANTKAALAVGERCRSVVRPYAVWEDPGGLRDVLAAIAGDLARPNLIGATLTAELADCFQTKEEGVIFVLRALESAFPQAPVRVFTSEGRFRSLEEALEIPYLVGSANWAASAHFLAAEAGSAYLIDVGSTTTDVIPIVEGRVEAYGTTDPERLTSGELVYTGAVRTPVCAIAGTVPFRGRRCRVAAEFFAQAGDVHVWLGSLPPGEYGAHTPDGRGATRREAGARLARSICGDTTLVAADEITRMAEHLAGRQVRAIAAGIGQVRRRLGDRAPSLVVGAGLGSFLAAAAARRAGLGYQPVAARLGEAASRALPAVAVARLLQRAEG